MCCQLEELKFVYMCGGPYVVLIAPLKMRGRRRQLKQGGGHDLQCKSNPGDTAKTEGGNI